MSPSRLTTHVLGAVLVAALVAPATGIATPAGQITQFPTGLSATDRLGGITTGPDGNLWFTAAGANAIGRMTPSGVTTIFTAGLSAGSGPFIIAAGPDGNLWFTQTQGNSIGRITPSGVVTEFSTGIAPGALPTWIVAGPDGALWFTERGSNRIGRITTGGTVSEFIVGVHPATAPFGLTAGPDGNLWFTQVMGRAVGRLTPQGGVRTFPLGGSDNSAATITTGSDGNLWFTDMWLTAGVSRVTPEGAITEYRHGITPLSQPFGIAQGPDGNRWFTEAQGGAVGRISSRGVVTEFRDGIPADAELMGITQGPDDAMWFTEPGTGHVGRITTEPTRDLFVTNSGPGTGVVTSSAPGITCGTTCEATFTRDVPVTLTAVPAAGSVFAGWSGAGCAGVATCTVLMQADQSVTATFTATQGDGASAAAPSVRLQWLRATTSPRTVAVASRARVNQPGRIDQRGTVVGVTGTPASGCRAARSVPTAATYALTCTLGPSTRALLARRAIRVRLVTTLTTSTGATARTTRTITVPQARRITPVTG